MMNTYYIAQQHSRTSRLALTREQAVFLDAVRRAGGLAGVVRSVEEAVQIVGERSQEALPKGKLPASR